MTSKTAQLNELIEITRDGKKFYEHAREEVKNVGLKALFTDMSRAKGEVIQALSAKVIANNEQPASGGTLMGKVPMPALRYPAMKRRPTWLSWKKRRIVSSTLSRRRSKMPMPICAPCWLWKCPRCAPAMTVCAA